MYICLPYYASFNTKHHFYQNQSIPFFIMYRWLWDLFRLGKSKDLKSGDLYDVLPENISEQLGNKLEM